MVSESYLLSLPLTLPRAAITEPSSFSSMHSPILFGSFGMEDHELQLVNVESPSELQSHASPSIQLPSDFEIPDLEIRFGSYGTGSPILTSSSSSVDLNIELQNIFVASTNSSPPPQLSSSSAMAATEIFDYSLPPFYYRPYDPDLDISYYHYYQDYCWYYEQHCQFYSSFASTDSSPPPLSSSSATVSDEHIVSVEGKFEDATKAVTEILENVFEDELEEEADSDDLILSEFNRSKENSVSGNGSVSRGSILPIAEYVISNMDESVCAHKSNGFDYDVHELVDVKENSAHHAFDIIPQKNVQCMTSCVGGFDILSAISNTRRATLASYLTPFRVHFTSKFSKDIHWQLETDFMKSVKAKVIERSCLFLERPNARHVMKLCKPEYLGDDVCNVSDALDKGAALFLEMMFEHSSSTDIWSVGWIWRPPWRKNRGYGEMLSAQDMKDTTSGNIEYETFGSGGPVAGGGATGITSIMVDKSVEFLYEELANATDKFSAANKICQGGFGVVCYGELREKDVAMKKMDMKASKEFIAEVKVLMNVQVIVLVCYIFDPGGLLSMVFIHSSCTLKFPKYSLRGGY